MNKVVIVILAIAAGILVYMFTATSTAVTAQGANLGEWTMDLDAAKVLAKDMDVPLMLKFTGSDWCGWCKLMEKSVFSKSEFLEYAGSNLRGTPQPRREQFANRLKAAGFDTTLRYSLGSDIAAACGQLVQHRREG